MVCTVLLVQVFSLDLLVQGISGQPPGYITFVLPRQLILSHVLDEGDGTEGYSYRAGSGLLVAALASNLEGNIVGGVALDLDGGGGEVVEVLVEQLEGQTEELAKMCHIMRPGQDELASSQLHLTG